MVKHTKRITVNSSQIGDEYHYSFECNSFNQKRKQSGQMPHELLQQPGFRRPSVLNFHI